MKYMSPYFRGNRILAMPPARKGRQGRDMVDKCAPHPWARAQNRPPTCEKIKCILLLFTLWSSFAQRDIPNHHTKHTRRQIVIYSRHITEYSAYK